jgi:malate synthase
MAVPFMKAYTDLLVQTCHRREAHALGGMAAFIPSRKDQEVNEVAMAKVREDKERESRNGFDGTWVAHPDLVPLAQSIFNDVLGESPNQKHRKRKEVRVPPAKLLSFAETGGKATEAGFRSNIEVALRYIERWISGQGAVAIHNLMEDAATAEICRAQLWQWIRHDVKLDDGRAATRELYRKIRDEEFSKLQESGAGRYAEAAEILDRLVLSEKFPEFLTLEAYSYLV